MWLRYLVVTLISALFLLALAVFGGYLYLQSWFENTELNITEPTLIEIPRGSHARRMASLLKEAGYIEEEKIFYYAVRLFAPQQQIHAGVYQLKPKETVQSGWQKWSQGEQYYFSITFAEGLNFKEWQQKIAANPWLTVQSSNLSAEELLQTIAPESTYTHPEGLLFPDTYRFYAYTSDLEIYHQAYQRMANLLTEAWNHRANNLPVKTPYEALILASIVEKETGAAHERGLVASVFSNRLRVKMRLQSDPTIIYGLGDRYQGVIYRSNIQETTAYNTYRIAGLPPTPIAMPGEAAIQAVLNPPQSEYYYFVSQNDGTHVFSKTLEAHNQAVQKYQRNR